MSDSLVSIIVPFNSEFASSNLASCMKEFVNVQPICCLFNVLSNCVMKRYETRRPDNLASFVKSLGRECLVSVLKA